MVISGSEITEYFSSLHYTPQLYFQCFYYKHVVGGKKTNKKHQNLIDALELDPDSIVTLSLTAWVTLEKKSYIL